MCVCVCVQISAGVGRFQLAFQPRSIMEGEGGSVPSTHAGGGANGPGGAIGIDRVDRVVRQRLEQAFNGVFGKLLESRSQVSERQGLPRRKQSRTRLTTWSRM